MKRFKLLYIMGIFFVAANAFASYDRIWDQLREKRGRFSRYPMIIEQLVEKELYFTSIPFIKEYLFKVSRPDPRLDRIIDEVITKTGIRQFELLPNATLKKSARPTLRYVLAKRMFRRKKYHETVLLTGSIRNAAHPVAPFALLLKASSLALLGKGLEAQSVFGECYQASERAIGKTDDYDRRRQLEMNRDYCLLGQARVDFKKKEYENAESTFLDLSKDSPVWPEILFEEAWNSFYLKNYNRTLGKLVTYNAPLLDFAFNPEVEELKALTYLEMCLYSDAKGIVENFYSKYERDIKKLRRLLKAFKKNFKAYYLMAKQRNIAEVKGTKLLNRLLKMITADPAFTEMYNSFHSARYEFQKLKEVSNPKLRKVLTDVVKNSLILQRDLIGSYVRTVLHEYYFQINRTLENLSYVNLEILDRKKSILINEYTGGERTRGSIANLVRSQKQYFWNFEGEFWLDELGDYVFSLKPECY